MKLPLFLVSTGDQPAGVDAPSTAEIATVGADFGKGAVAVSLFTYRTLAERLARVMPPKESGPWSVKTLATEDEARRVIEVTAARHPDWKWSIDNPGLPSDPPGNASYVETAAILEMLSGAAALKP